MKLDEGFEASNPYDQVALIYGIFACERCPEFIAGEADTPYHVIGEKARRVGWRVEANGNDWRILCPRCKDR